MTSPRSSTSRPWTSRAAAVVLLTLLVVLAHPGAAAAHGRVLKSSTPADGAAVAELTDIVLRFSTPVLAEYSMFALTDTSGASSAVQPTFTPDNRSVTLSTGTSLAPGGYRLAYRVVADDGHPAVGSIGFTVGDTSATPPPRPSPAPPSQPGLLSPDRFATDRALPWVLAGAGVLVVAGLAYLITRRSSPR